LISQANEMLSSYYSYIGLIIFFIPIPFLLYYVFTKQLLIVVSITIGYLASFLFINQFGIGYPLALYLLIGLSWAASFILSKRKIRFVYQLSISFIVICFTFLCIALPTFYSNNELSPPGAILDKETLLSDIQIINQNVYKTTYSSIEQYTGNFLINDGISNNHHTGNTKYLDIQVKHKQAKDDEPAPYEIVHAMSVWLYLYERTVPFDIVGIKCLAREQNNMTSGEVFITKYEVNELLKNDQKKWANIYEHAQDLAIRWVNQFESDYEKLSESNRLKRKASK